MIMHHRTTRATSWLLCVLLLGGAFLHSLHHCLTPTDEVPVVRFVAANGSNAAISGGDHVGHLEVKHSEFCCPVCSGALSLYAPSAENFELIIAATIPERPRSMAAVLKALPESHRARGPPAA